MIFTDTAAQGVARGGIQAVVRRWATCRVKPGTTLRTTAGVIAIDTVEQVALDDLDEHDAANVGYDSLAALHASLPDIGGHAVFRIGVRWHGPDPRDELASTEVTAAEVEQIDAALSRLDARSPRGPWTRVVLDAIAAHPACRAAHLADLLDRDKDPLKLDIRKLKNLGLTRSLDVGYRLSARGESYLDATLG